MTEERMRVLKMVEEGKVTPEEGARLIEAIRNREGQSMEPARAALGRCLRVRVFEGDQEKPKVNVTVPLALARLALKFIPHSALEQMEEQGISAQDLSELVAAVEKAGPFKIVDVQDGSEKVEVFIE